MPFERYFEREDNQVESSCKNSGVDAPRFFQLPQFMLNGPPALANQGGAEFFQLQQGAGSSWLTNHLCLQDSTYYDPSNSFSTFSTLSNALHFPSLTEITSVGPKNDAKSSPELCNPYSSSGFDFLSLLARVVSRPHPNVVLGHVDLSCSFVVVDVRRHDSPIIYCSPTFCHLTGYEEQEILGKNCRFLQSPNGIVLRGEHRQHSTLEAIVHLKKCLLANKECQTQIINYRKGGAAFTNLLTVIPIPGGVNGLPHETDDFVYHVGFQVELKDQSQAILQHLPNGGYIVNYSSSTISPSIRDSRSHITPVAPLSNVLRSLFRDPLFVQSTQVSSASTSVVRSTAPKKAVDEAQQALSILLLESSPDFIHVVSMKGSLLYVAPSVQNVLGYEPEELIGKSISEFCHPADLVPLMRELKESSISSLCAYDIQTSGNGMPPKIVDILFRAQSKNHGFLWVECRGRLHVEPGKGRKAIVLSGRARRMPQLKWESVAQAGGLVPPSYIHRRACNERPADKDRIALYDLEPVQQEFWGMIMPSGTLLSVETGVQDVLGWEADELVGKDLAAFCVFSGVNKASRLVLPGALASASERSDSGHNTIQLALQSKGGRAVDVVLVLFSSIDQVPSHAPPYCPLVFQIRRARLSPDTSIVHRLDSNIFEELDISRGTSWQYELQQLKFKNQKLAQEIHDLEQLHLVALSNACQHSGQNQPRVFNTHTALYNSGIKRTWDSVDGTRNT